LTPATLSPTAIDQLSRAFEHLPSEFQIAGKDANINDIDILTAVRLARTLRILAPLEGEPASADSASDDRRKDYLGKVQIAQQHLYQPPPDAPPIRPNDFHEAKILVLAYSVFVADFLSEISKRAAKALECLEAIESRRQLGHESDEFTYQRKLSHPPYCPAHADTFDRPDGHQSDSGSAAR